MLKAIVKYEAQKIHNNHYPINKYKINLFITYYIFVALPLGLCEFNKIFV